MPNNDEEEGGKDVERLGLAVSCTVTVGSAAPAPAVTAIEEEEEDHIVFSAIIWCGSFMRWRRWLRVLLLLMLSVQIASLCVHLIICTAS
jgi:hypothetical protein